MFPLCFLFFLEPPAAANAGAQPVPPVPTVLSTPQPDTTSSTPTPRPASSTTSTVQAPLRFDTTRMDLGVVNDDGPITRPFAFTNTLTRSATVWLSFCHFCPAATSDKPTYAPGQSGTILLEIDPAGKRGPVRSTATVGVKDVDHPGVTLLMTAMIRPRACIDPPQLFLQGRAGQPSETSVTLLGGDPVLTITSIESPVPWLTVTPSKPQPVDNLGVPGVGIDLLVRVAPDAPPGNHQPQVTITTSDPKARPVQLPVGVEVQGDLEFQPGVVGQALFTLDPFAVNFRVVSASGKPIQLVSLDVLELDSASDIVMDITTPAKAGAEGVACIVRGIAPANARQLAQVKLEARVLVDGVPSSLVIPINLAVTQRP